MSTRPLLVRLALASLLFLLAAQPAHAADAQGLLKRIGSPRGIAVLLGDDRCEAAIALSRASDLVVYVQLPKGSDLAAAQRAADEAGLYGTRIFVEQGDLARIHLADDVADAVVAVGKVTVPREEALRVLRPDGRAILTDADFTKPMPQGVDDWSHHFHGPDNNTQSRDTLARAPYLTQFIVEPRYAPAPQAAVLSNGRIFMAFGHVAWHEREEGPMNTLIAKNAFNGTTLWTRPLKPGFMVDRSTMIATPATLYLADDASCKLLDAATGEVRDEIAVPADVAGGTFWKWMALEDGVLYALIGKAEPPDPDATWKSRGHGWPWGGISKGYNDAELAWGFSQTLLAIDPKTKRVLWAHHEDDPIDARALCMKSGHIFVSHFGKYLACVDAKTGLDVWRRTADKDKEVFDAIGPYRPGQGWVEGWRTAAYAKCTDAAIFFVGPQVNWLSALSAQDGRPLWKYPARDAQIVIRDDAVYAIGSQSPQGVSCKIDPRTGQVLNTFQVQRRACTRATGSADGILFRASEGSVRLDTGAEKPQWITPMRPSCHVGVVIGDGHLYWLPWACDCNLQMFGVIACGPAGDFQFDAEATEAARLEPGTEDRAATAKWEPSPDDWPTYRANNDRTARTSAALVDKVGLLWQYDPKAKAEPTAPVAAGGLVFIGASDGTVRTLDAKTGKPRWTRYTGGAIRYPPAIAGGLAYVGSGDGWAYVYEAADGRLVWRFRAAPAERKIPFYGSLLSTWPVAGGVLVDGGTAYLAAGINNFDGTHVYALDAVTGKIKWQNNTCGHLDAFSRRGVAAQGDLLLANGKLYVAGGDAASPGVFDLADGKCQTPVPTAPGSSAPRGRELVLAGNNVRVTGQPLYSLPSMPVFDDGTKWEPEVVTAKNGRLSIVEGKAGGGPTWTLLAQAADGRGDLWRQDLPGEPVRWGLAVDSGGRVIVALRDGRVMCYGAP
jgi:outer membrane protein assembly factor BamB